MTNATFRAIADLSWLALNMQLETLLETSVSENSLLISVSTEIKSLAIPRFADL